MHSQNHNLRHLLIQSLREKPNSYIVNEILNRFPSIPDLLDITVEELMAIDGIGKIKAQQIIAMLKLSHVITQPVTQPDYIRSPADAYYLLEHEMRNIKQEHFACLFLNTKNGIIGKETITIGTLNASLVHPREVFRPAIKRACASIICAHNHPSGNPEPSLEDITITKRLVEAGQIIGIDVLDHIIIGSHSYVSLKECGHI